MEMVKRLRELGGIVEERRVERWSGNESYNVWLWQIKKGNGEWADALPVYRDLLTVGSARMLAGSVNTFDLLNLIK